MLAAFTIWLISELKASDAHHRDLLSHRRCLEGDDVLGTRLGGHERQDSRPYNISPACKARVQNTCSDIQDNLVLECYLCIAENRFAICPCSSNVSNHIRPEFPSADTDAEPGDSLILQRRVEIEVEVLVFDPTFLPDEVSPLLGELQGRPGDLLFDGLDGNIVVEPDRLVGHCDIGISDGGAHSEDQGLRSLDNCKESLSKPR
jgi:hypothetical protein